MSSVLFAVGEYPRRLMSRWNILSQDDLPSEAQPSVAEVGGKMSRWGRKGHARLFTHNIFVVCSGQCSVGLAVHS